MAAKNTPKKSNFAVESAKQATGPSPGMLALIAAGNENQAKLIRRNMPAMVKPGDVPIGSAISGEIIAVFNSPVSTVKGKLLHIRHAGGTEFTFPATGVIRQALAGGVENDAELTKALEKNIGKHIVCKRLDDKTTTKYSGKGEAPKKMYVFDVFTD